MKFLSVVALIVMLVGCGNKSSSPIPQPSSETYDQFLVRTEGVNCAQITAHDIGAPIPDCKKMHDAFDRGRTNLINKGFPQAATMLKMSGVSFWQTQQVWNPNEVFPRMKDLGAMAEFLPLENTIFFAFEECIQHEVQHWGLLLLDGQEMRMPDAIALPKDADQANWDHIWQIACHDTSDDRFGDGTSLSVSGRAGCVEPYSRPPKP